MPKVDKSTTYLGDGVYAHFDGMHVNLDLREGGKPYLTEKIGIEDHTAKTLIWYLLQKFPYLKSYVRYLTEKE